jgi:cytochrome c-type protein NapC
MADHTPPNDPGTSGQRKSWLSRLLNPPRCSMLRMLGVGSVLGIVIWGALNMGMEYTNRSEFCLSCHEMSIPYEELKKTVHFKNRSGAAAQCADCHVASSKTPTDYMFKSFQKLMAARDVVGKITGIVDTPEKFEAHRLTMAKRVWARMEERDSKECRNCHDFKYMDPEKQKDRSVVKHEGAVEDGKTCIECHKGIAHKPVHQAPEQTSAAQPES